MSNNMEKTEKIRIIKESFETLRARNIVKTQGDFANLLGISQKSLSAAKNGVDGYCTDSLVSKIMGLMREQEQSIKISNSPNSPVTIGDNNNVEIGQANPERLPIMPYQVKCIPTIPIHAYRAVGFDVMEYFDSTSEENLHMSPIVHQFPGSDCYYFVNSDVMSPNLQMNDLLCLSRLPDGARVTNGDLYIINTKYQGMLERFVYDDGDAFILKATQPRWTEMRIPKEEIFSVFRILGGIRTNI